jgi:hypothetical protein
MMATLYSQDMIKDKVIIPVYYRDKKNKTRQFNVECPLQDLDLNMAFARMEVFSELMETGNYRDGMAILSAIRGGKHDAA